MKKYIEYEWECEYIPKSQGGAIFLNANIPSNVSLNLYESFDAIINQEKNKFLVIKKEDGISHTKIRAIMIQKKTNIVFY